MSAKRGGARGSAAANAPGARSRSGRILLVRHADAGERAEWTRNPVARLVSSGYVRCVETFVPLGGRLGLLTETAGWLEEGADPERALTALLVGGSVAACSHGDVVSGILFELAERGIALGSSPRMQKGSTWVLDVQDGAVKSARYLPPPD